MCINFQFWVFNKLQFISFAAFILFLSKAFSHIENFVINNIDWKQCVSGKAFFFFKPLVADTDESFFNLYFNEATQG